MLNDTNIFKGVFSFAVIDVVILIEQYIDSAV